MGSINWSAITDMQPQQPAPIRKGAINWDALSEQQPLSLPDQMRADAGLPIPAKPLSLVDQMRADAAAPAAHPVAIAQPEPYGHYVQDFLSAAGHHLMNLPHGAAQLIENAVAKGASSLPDNPVSRAIINTAARDNAAMQAREKAYQAATPDNPASYAGAAVGEVAPLAFGAGARAIQTVGDKGTQLASALLGKKVLKVIPQAVGGAAQGATLGALLPVTKGGDYWSNKGEQVATTAPIGAAMPVGIATVGSVARNLGDAARPFTNPDSLIGPVLAKAGGNDPAALSAALRNYAPPVPGSSATFSQIAQTPEAVMLEKTMSNTPLGKVAFSEIANGNNAARVRHLNSLAGTDQDVQAAIADRSNAVSDYLATLKNHPPIDASPILSHIESLSKSGLGMNPVVRRALADIRTSLSENGTTADDGSLLVSPDALNGIRQNVRDYLQQNASNGAVSSKQEAALAPLKNTIDNAIESGVPGYRDYLATYAAKSVPINTMEALQKVTSAVDNGALDSSGAPQLTLTKARQTVNQLDKARNPISPEADQAVNDVLQDLQRDSISSSIKTNGSDTALNLATPSWLARQLYGTGFSGDSGPTAKLAGALLGGIAGHGFAGAAGGYLGVSKLADIASSRVNAALIKALSDTPAAADIIDKYGIPVESNPRLLGELLRRVPVLTPYAAKRVHKPLDQTNR